MIALLASPVACKDDGSVLQEDTMEAREVIEVVASSLNAPVSVDLARIKERGSLNAILNNSSTGYLIY